MQFMVSNLTGLPPVWGQGSYSDSGVIDFKGGISTGANHYDVSPNPPRRSTPGSGLTRQTPSPSSETERVRDQVC